MLEHRQNIRMRVDSGGVILLGARVPSMTCELLEINETGCRCKVRLNTLNEEMAAKWQRLLNSHAMLSVAILRPLDLFKFTLNARAIHMETLHDAEIEVGLQFIPESCQEESLLLTLAAWRKKRTEAPPSRVSPPIARSHSQNLHAFKSVQPCEAKADRLALNASTLIQALQETPPATCTEDSHAAAWQIQNVSKLFFTEPHTDPAELSRALHVKSFEINLDIAQVPAPVNGIFSYLTMQRYRFMPFASSDQLVCVVAPAPLSIETLQVLKEKSGRHVLDFLANGEQIHALQHQNRPMLKARERAHTRIRSDVPTAYQIVEIRGEHRCGDFRHGVTLNLSEGGALLMGPAESEVAKEDLVDKRNIHVCIDPLKQSIHVNARIVFVKPMANNAEVWLYGLEWVGITEPEAHKLSDLYRSTALEQHRTRRSAFAIA